MSGVTRQLRIVGDGVTAKVELDGFDLSSGIRGLVLTMKAGELPELQIDPLVVRSDVVATAFSRTTVHAEAHKALVWLGWTPPVDDAPPSEVEP